MFPSSGLLGLLLLLGHQDRNSLSSFSVLLACVSGTNG
jgi:hypothetical protein